MKWQKYKKTRDYRQFLSLYLQEENLSLADFARSTGFGRGFPGEVLAGKRKLTAKSFPPFENALRLPNPGRKYFRYLVALESPELFPKHNPEKTEHFLHQLRSKPWNRVREKSATPLPSQPSLFSDPAVFKVYAAAGDSETGSSLEQLRDRTELAEDQLQAALRQLSGADLMEMRADRYFLNDPHVYLKTQGADRHFAELFRQLSAEAVKKSRHRTFVRPGTLFYFLLLRSSP